MNKGISAQSRSIERRYCQSAAPFNAIGTGPAESGPVPQVRNGVRIAYHDRDRKPLHATSPEMTVLQGMALFVVAYLVLLGRNAWKQGELRQYLVALAMAGILVAVIAASVFAYDRLVAS